MKQAVLAPFFGRLRDRFCEYGEPIPLRQKLESAVAIPGVEGVEVIFPDEGRNAAELRGMLTEFGLAVAAVNVNLKGDPDFVHGALSSPDAGIRRKAFELMCAAKRFALELGADKVTCAPLADGYDYPFQVDYRAAWRRTLDVLGNAAACVPEIALYVEHKPAEPRTRGLLDCAAKVVRLCREIAHPRIGVTFNVGHAFFGGGIPADDFSLVLWSGLPYYIHYCDGTEGWDWDLMAGSRHYWQWAEFLFYLKDSGYRDWITADVFPVRQPAADLFAANVRMTSHLWRWIDSLDRDAVRAKLESGEALPMLKELEACLP